MSKSPYQFNPGDEVKCLKSTGGYTEGKVYVVRSWCPTGYYDWGTLMTMEDDGGSSSNGWSDENFEPHNSGGPW